MSEIKTVVIPLTATQPARDEDYYRDGWSVDVIVDMDFIRKVQSLLEETEKYLQGERDSGAPKHPLELVESLHCGLFSHRAVLKYAAHSWIIPLEYYRIGWDGDTEFWGHPTREFIGLSRLFDLIKEAEAHPDWVLVNPYTVRCGDALVTTLEGSAAYNAKNTSLDDKHLRTLYHQIDRAGGLGWIPSGVRELYKHDERGAPIPAPKLKEILARARLEGKEHWAMYKVLRRLYEKLGGK